MLLAGFAFLESLQVFGVRPGLDSTEKLCLALGNPEKSFSTIHIVGTNGKGSTSLYLSKILQNHQKKVALYTSPHLISLCERLRINDLPVSEEILNQALLKVKEAALKENISPTYFETLTVAAFLICKEQGIEVLVAEAGLGGRFDATAVAKGTLTILTSIGLEHTAILGDSEEKILLEKLGIMQQETHLVHFPLTEKLSLALNKFKEEKGINIVSVIETHLPKLQNLGRHYTENATLALSAARFFLKNEFSEPLSYEALEKAFWPGRMQLLYDKSGKLRYILDGAHNPHAVKRLVLALQENFPNEKFVTILGVLQDKDHSEMLQMLSNVVSEFYPSGTPYERFTPVETLKMEIENLGLKVKSGNLMSPEFLEDISKNVSTPILITGSLYLIGASIEILKADFNELAFFQNLKPFENERH